MKKEDHLKMDMENCRFCNLSGGCTQVCIFPGPTGKKLSDEEILHHINWEYNHAVREAEESFELDRQAYQAGILRGRANLPLPSGLHRLLFTGHEYELERGYRDGQANPKEKE